MSANVRNGVSAATIQALHFETLWRLFERKSRTKMEETMNLYGPKQLAESMRTVRKNTIQIAEDIPEKDYNYRPTAESRSVLETLVHIASLSRFDRIVHAEQHLSSLEGGCSWTI